MCVPETALVRKPVSLTFEEAAAIPQAGAIALQAIRLKGQVRPGHKVLINGADGAAGSFVVQLAKLAGAEVTGVDRSDKADLLRSLGADLSGGRVQSSWIHPYLHGFAGFSIYATQSGLGGWGTSIPYFGFATTTNQWDAAFTWGGGGGMRFALPIQSRPVQLGISARYQRSGDVDYLREGDLVDLPDGSYLKELQRGKTDFVAFTMGGSVGFSFPRTSESDP